MQMVRIEEKVVQQSVPSSPGAARLDGQVPTAAPTTRTGWSVSRCFPGNFMCCASADKKKEPVRTFLAGIEHLEIVVKQKTGL